MTFNGKLCHDSNSPWKAELEPIIRTQALVTSLSPLTQTSQALGLSGDPRCSLLVSQPEPAEETCNHVSMQRKSRVTRLNQLRYYIAL